MGAGTGKLTAALLARGLQVVAVEPDGAMLAELVRHCPGALVALASAEALPLPTASVDAVLVGQAWHWFSYERALAEVRRVIRPGGWLGLTWNASDPQAHWEQQLEELDPDSAYRNNAGPGAERIPGLSQLVVEEATFRWHEDITAQSLAARLATHSAYIMMPADLRASRLAAAGAIVAAEAARRGTAALSFGLATYCARVRL